MNRTWQPGGCLVLLLATTAPAAAQLMRENQAPIETRGVADLNGGLLMDNTVAPLGREFFTGFATAWRELDSAQRYSLLIAEQPTARLGSTIRVQHKTTTVFQTVLRASRQAARDLSQQAAGELFQTLLATEAGEALFKDPDLGAQELQ